MAEIIKEFWAVILAVLTGVIWLVRMESKTLANDREIRRLWEQRKEDQNTAKESRDDVKSSLSQMQSSLDDIRQILMTRDK